MIGHGYSRFRVITCHLMPAIVAVVIGIVVIGLTAERHSVEVGTLKVVPPVVRPGGTAYAVFSLTDYSHGRCNQGNVHRWLIDSRGILYTLSDTPVVQTTPAQIADNAKGQDSHTFAVRVNFPVPLGISEGPAMYHAQAERWCTLIQRLWPVSGHFESRFTVDSINGELAPEPDPPEVTKPAPLSAPALKDSGPDTR